MHALLAHYCDLPKAKIRQYATSIKERHLLSPAVDSLAAYIQRSIQNRDIDLPHSKNRVIHDGISQKVRTINIACILQQIYDYIAKIGLQELFDAKFAPHQYATIKGRGQTYGLVFWQRWMNERKQTFRFGKIQRGKPVSTYGLDVDVRQCYPSISIGKLKKLLRRDVRNDTLLWLTFFLIDKMCHEKKNIRGITADKNTIQFASYDQMKGLRAVRIKRGISIGSYLSCNLCNYMISYAWHFVQEQVSKFEMKKGKDGVFRRIRSRLITHCGIYMDNITILGANKRDLMRAREMLEAFMRKTLGMRLKRSWRLYRLAYQDGRGKEHGSPVDTMGYVVYRDRTLMRGKVFLRARRKYRRLMKTVWKKARPSRKLCSGVVSYNGWFQHTDSREWQRKNNFKFHVFRNARRLVSVYAKEENHHARQCESKRCAVAG